LARGTTGVCNGIGENGRGDIKGWNIYHTLSFHIGRTEVHLQFKREKEKERKRERDSRIVNEELVAVFLDAEALGGDFGAVNGQQLGTPRLEPPAVPLLRERAA